MLDINRRTKKSKRRTTGGSSRTRSKPGRTSRRRYQQTTRAAKLTVYGQGAGFSLESILNWRKGRRRRSQSRLGTRAAPVSTGSTRSVARSRPAVRIPGRALVNISVIGLLGWLLIWLFAADQFYIYQIVVEGNQRVSAEAIVLSSGIQGYSIFWVDAGAVAEKIVEALPPIRQVRVRHSLPNAVVLTVEEQGEQIMWMVAGKRYWVDDEGKLHPAQGGSDPQLLVQDIRPGLPSQVDVEAVVAARQIAQLLPDLTSIEYAPVRGLHFSHPAGWMVYLGVGEDMLQKVHVLRAIEQRLSVEGARQPDLVDIRFPQNPYYRYPEE